MTDKCYSIEELAEIGALEADHPLRLHLETCARCRARFRTYVEFLEAPPAVTGRQREEAMERLGAALDREIRATAARRAHAVAERPRPRREWRPFLERFWQPAGALVAATLVIAVGLGLLKGERERDGIVLRSDQGSTARAALEPVPAEIRADGSVVLAWSRLAGATAHRIEILGPELDLLGTLEAGPDTVLVVPSRRLSRILPSPGAYAWTVTALDGGDVLERSRPATLTIPPESLEAPAGGNPHGE